MYILYIILATFCDMIKLVVDWSYYRNDSNVDSYQISTYDLIICKLRRYLYMFCSDLSTEMLLFASINLSTTTISSNLLELYPLW